MPNETEIPSMQSERSSTTGDEATADSSPSYQGARGGNGFESTASQYRAMQEAQLLHEETINQLREEVLGQRDRLAELARANPGQRNGQLDVAMLRLSELERKIGEGAPDPLINEIVHRLAALENAGPMRGAKDPRIDEVTAQLDGLRHIVAETDHRDSRTDDVVLRIASLEGAFRRAAQSRDPEEVQARIDALSEALDSRQAAELAQLRSEFSALSRSSAEAASKATDAASAGALDALAERFAGIERRLSETRAHERLTEMGSQLAALDRKLSEQNIVAIGTRVQTLEQRAAVDSTDAVLELIADRITVVEQKVEENPAAGALERLGGLESRLDRLETSPEIASLRERVSVLKAELEESGSQRAVELARRLHALEARLDAASAADRGGVAAFEERLARLDRILASKASSEEIARLEQRLSAIRSDAAQAGPELPADLSARLAELENRLSEAESSSRLEDADARLSTVETKLGALGEPAEIGRRLTVLEMDTSPAEPRLDDVLQRLAALETKPFEPLSDSRLHELSRSVADLQGELERVSKERLSLLTELPGRLAHLEKRLVEVAAQKASESGPMSSLGELQSQIGAVTRRVEELSARPAGVQDARVSELIARVEWVERNQSGQGGGPDLDELVRRLEAVERGVSAGPETGSLSRGVQTELSMRLSALEQELRKLEESAGASTGILAVEAALEKESGRWTQWARTTMEEIGELRDRVESSVAPAGSGLDAESVETLAVQISAGLNNAEAKALRNQMYFVYLSLGVMWAVLLFVLFAK